MKEQIFGISSKGEEIKAYTLTNKNGMEAVVTDFGAILVSLKAKDKYGEYRDVVLGYDTLKAYESNPFFFGAIIGRNANRTGGAVINIDGHEYRLSPNENGNNLHSNPDGYHLRRWNVEHDTVENGEMICFYLDSEDGDQGYPGNARIMVTYTLSDENELLIWYHAETDRDTVVNMTNHSYFNLNGHKSGSILKHQVQIFSDEFTVSDEKMIPTGEIRAVDGTPLDFRRKKTVGQDIEAAYEPLILAGGYDHNFVVNDGEVQDSAELVASLEGDESGIAMEVYTDLPGMQLYSGNFVDESWGKDGAVYGRHSGICFESQFYPDALHHDNFPSTILRKDKEYISLTVYRFLTEE